MLKALFRPAMIVVPLVIGFFVPAAGDLAYEPYYVVRYNLVLMIFLAALGIKLQDLKLRREHGLLLAAKDPKLAKKLSRSVSGKHYMVIVHGDFPETLEADGFLTSANSVVRKKRKFVTAMPETPPFESAKTAFRKISGRNGLSLVEATLFTGRMHQIRATVNSLGFPVAGDKLYGVDETFYLKQRTGELTEDDRKKLLLPRQALHSALLAFTHPDSGETLTFSSSMPEDMQNLLI